MPQILRNLTVHEVSSVDRGAGEGVKVVLMKRDFTSEERKAAAARGNAMPDGSFPIKNVADLENAINAIGRAKNPAAAKAHVRRRARALGRADLIPTGWAAKALDPGVTEVLRTAFGVPEELLLSKASDERFVVACNALGESVDSILKSEVERDAKIGAVGKSLDQYVDHITGIAPEIALAIKRGAEPMPTLKDQLQKAFAASTDAEKDAVRKELEGSVAGLETGLATAKADVAKAETETKLWKSRVHTALGLEKAAKDYMNHPDNTDDEEETCKFLDLSPAERIEHMKAHPIEVMTQKRIDALPEPVRKQLAEGQAAAQQVAKMHEERDVEAFAKRAAALGQPAEFGASLRTLAKGLGTDEERATAFDVVVKALEAAAAQAKAAGLFREFGTTQGAGGSAHDQLVAKAGELRASIQKAGASLSPDQAFAKVYEDPANRELVRRYRAETQRPAA